ncbi:MAG: flagellar hook protein FlgE [Rhodothermales bacterium]
MIRSLRTGVTGLQTNQVKMDVTGNNVANVNTLAFKRGRAAFNELLGQQLLGVGRLAGGSGVNPAYVGLGVAVGSIDQNWTQGAIENTNRATDLAMNGDGFFIARSAIGNVLTRAGNFSFNRHGEFVTSNGLPVQGWSFDDNGNVVTGILKDIKIDQASTTPAQATQNILVGGNFDNDLPTGSIKVISTPVFDAGGNARDVQLRFTKQISIGDDLGGGGVGPYASASHWEGEILDANGDPVLDSNDEDPETQNGDPINLYFDNTGTLVNYDDGTNTTSALAADLEYTYDWDMQGGGDDTTMTLNFGGGDRANAVTSYAASQTLAITEQDGYQSGTLIGNAINQEGILELNYSNGQQIKAYQLAVGQVSNPHGLEQRGDNFFGLTTASGELSLRQAGRNSGTVVISGALEMSNVDLASEFTDMIVAQRGFQASARVITTSDELLQETVQLKR